METLRKITIIWAIIIAFSGVLLAQENIQTAFSESYTLETNGDYSGAIEKIKSVYSESSYEINLRLGWLSYMNGLFTESLAYYKKAINLMPLSIEAKIGYVYPASALGNWDDVINQYNEILKIDKKNYTANYKIGLIYYGRKEYNKAYSYFEICANLYPFDYYSNLYLAWTNYFLGKTREAGLLFNKVLLISPEDESAIEGLGKLK